MLSRVVRGTRVPSRLPLAAGHGRAGGVEAGHRETDQHREDHRTEGQVQRLGPRRQPSQDLQAADRDLDREQRGRGDRQPHERGLVRCVRHATTATAATIAPTTAATQRCSTWGDVSSVRAGQRPVHERPIREDERPIGRGHVRPEEQQRERGERRERREEREALAPPRRRGGPGNRHGRSRTRAGPRAASQPRDAR